MIDVRLRSLPARLVVLAAVLALLAAGIATRSDLEAPCWLRSTSPDRYDIVVAAPAVEAAGREGISTSRARELARDLRDTLERQVTASVPEEGVAASVGAPCRSAAADLTSRRAATLERARAAQNADVAVSFVLHPRRRATTVRLEVAAAGRTGYVRLDELDIGPFAEARAGREIAAARPHIRLMHAIRLYATGDYPAAARILGALRQQPLPPGTRRLAGQLLRRTNTHLRPPS